ncbi:hypothetical protein DFH09DRAFT_1380409 [Mycena vulgaris]|nr:hypothetical protein DFH09DRAFT_1380409 [Mycena vulgaris]
MTVRNLPGSLETSSDRTHTLFNGRKWGWARFHARALPKLVNWALALAVVYLSIVAAVAPAHAPELLFVPLTVILTIPARAVRRRAPLRCVSRRCPTNASLSRACYSVNILGLFMQMALVSLCSIVATLRIARA